MSGSNELLYVLYVVEETNADVLSGHLWIVLLVALAVTLIITLIIFIVCFVVCTRRSKRHRLSNGNYLVVVCSS